MIRAARAACLLAALVLAGGASAEDAALVIDGRVRQVQHLSVDMLRALPSERREVAFRTDRGESKATYLGVRLWALIERAGIDDDAPRWGDLRHVLAVTGKDGYLVMLSLGEIDPYLGNAPILVAYERDGQPIAGGLRLVVSGDAHGARSVRDMVHIEVR